MTAPTTLAVVAGAVLVLGAATWLSIPRPPELDGERWFKTWLITLLRGATEAEGKQAEDWAAAVLRHVPWHPAGRTPERKILHPEDPPATPALDGEIELHRALSTLPDPASRWRRMYDQDEEGLSQRLEDPHLLGEAYDPARWLGEDAGWEALAEHGGCPERLAAATEASWILVGERLDASLPDLGGALERAMGTHALRYDPDADVPDPPQRKALAADIATRRAPEDAAAVLHLLSWLHERAPEHSDHLVLVGIGAGMHPILEALRTSPVLRDQVDAVISIGGIIQGLDDAPGSTSWQACTDWLQAHYRHELMDLEAAHQTPHFALQWLDRSAAVPGAAGLPLDRARFPEPPSRGVKRRSMQPVDLGVLPVHEDFPVDLAAMALWGMVTAWLRAHRS